MEDAIEGSIGVHAGKPSVNTIAQGRRRLADSPSMELRETDVGIDVNFRIKLKGSSGHTPIAYGVIDVAGRNHCD